MNKLRDLRKTDFLIKWNDRKTRYKNKHTPYWSPLSTTVSKAKNLFLLFEKAMSIIQTFSSEKGKAMIGYEGYVYTLERKTDAKSIFRCQNRDCKGKLKVKKWFLSLCMSV